MYFLSLIVFFMKTCNKYYTGIFKTCIDIIYYNVLDNIFRNMGKKCAN